MITLSRIIASVAGTDPLDQCDSLSKVWKYSISPEWRNMRHQNMKPRYRRCEPVSNNYFTYIYTDGQKKPYPFTNEIAKFKLVQCQTYCPNTTMLHEESHTRPRHVFFCIKYEKGKNTCRLGSQTTRAKREYKLNGRHVKYT